MTSDLRAKLVRNIDEVVFETSDRAPLYDGGRSAGVIGPRLAGVVARKLGAAIDVLPPGKRACPYHLHHAQEELFVILEGRGTLRVAGEMIPIRAGDVIDIPCRSARRSTRRSASTRTRASTSPSRGRSGRCSTAAACTGRTPTSTTGTANRSLARRAVPGPPARPAAAPAGRAPPCRRRS